MIVKKINEPMEAFHTIDKQTEMELGEISLKSFTSTFRVKPREFLRFIRFLSKNNIFDLFIDTISEEDILVRIDGETIRNIDTLVM